jgi:hypothetical protein
MPALLKDSYYTVIMLTVKIVHTVNFYFAA